MITVLGLVNGPFEEAAISLVLGVCMNALDVLATYLAADAMRIDVMPDLAGPFCVELMEIVSVDI